MLLNSLSILMGAVLVPSDYLWMYSTHIVLACLYLLISKRLIVLVFTLLSLISVYFSEFNQDILSLPLNLVGQKAYLNADNRQFILLSDPFTSSKSHYEGQRISISGFDANGERVVIDDLTLVFTEHLPVDLPVAQIMQVTLPDKNGRWWQRQLYVQRQAVQFRVKFSAADELLNLKLMILPPTLRGTFVEELDKQFRFFSSWRFSRALLLGNNDLWSERDVWLIRSLGLAHLFVVSGLHVGFAFGLGCLFSRFIWHFSPSSLRLAGLSRFHIDAISVIPILVFYAYLTGWGEPVIRASIMLSVYLMARLLSIKFSAYDVITFALWLVLLFDPRAILQPGLWLSFSMVYLLIGFCQTSIHWSRLFMVQLMLSTASMVLVLGWQQAISSVAILVNLLLIPVAAFVWFPWGMLACLEAIFIGTSYAYALLDLVLEYLLQFIEFLAFSAPLFFFASFHSLVPKLVMLFLLVYWVYQTPLKRGALAVCAIWLTLFLVGSLHLVEPSLELKNQRGELVLKKQQDILLSAQWTQKQVENLDLSSYMNGTQQRLVLSTENGLDWSPRDLLTHHVDWLFLQDRIANKAIIYLSALQVNWLVLLPNESLAFYFQDGRISLRHSDCIYSFFLFKSDTCKRVEKLESMLN